MKGPPKITVFAVRFIGGVVGGDSWVADFINKLDAQNYAVDCNDSGSEEVEGHYEVIREERCSGLCSGDYLSR